MCSIQFRKMLLCCSYIALSLVKSFIGAKDVSIDTRSINRQVIRNKYDWKCDLKGLIRSMIRVFASLKIVR